jgi:hypothetical protein
LRGGGVARAAGSGPAGVYWEPVGVVVIVVVEVEVRRTRNWQCASADTTDGVALVRHRRAVSPWPRARSSMWGAWFSRDCDPAPVPLQQWAVVMAMLAMGNTMACPRRLSLVASRVTACRAARWARLIIRVLAQSNPTPTTSTHLTAVVVCGQSPVFSRHRTHTCCTRVLRVSRLSNRHQDSACDYYVSSYLDPIHPLHNLALAPSACTGSTDRASIQLATSSLNASLSLPGSSCTVAVSLASPHTVTCSHRW